MSNENLITTAYRTGYETALREVARGLKEDPFFHAVEREVALESVANARQHIDVLAAGFCADIDSQMEVR